MHSSALPARAGLAIVLLSVSGLVVAGCAPSGSGAPSASSGTSAEGCGVVPTTPVSDPSGLLAEFPEDIVNGFNLWPYEIRKSAWADYASEKTEGYTAALVGMPPASPFIATMTEAIRSSLEAEGVEIVADFAPDDPSNVPLQLQQFNEALALKPDVIIYTPIAPEPSIDLVKQAFDAGIPVIAAQVPIDSEYAISVTRNVPLAVAEVTAGTLGAIGGKGSVLRVQGIPGIPNTTFADLGTDAILDTCPEVKVVGEVTGFFQPATAQAEVLKFLSTNPAGVDAVLQSGTMGLGIYNAFVESGLEAPPIADDGATQGFSAWALQNPDYPYFGTTTPSVRTGEVVAEVALRTLKGEGPKINQIVQPSVIVTQDNLADYAEESWKITDGADLAGSPDDYEPTERLDQFFTNPAS
ncbi:substrate-binding domain-containing protein [Microbacterium sp. 1.5R]|uniref:substrate-binding domain-containing protein n=1 Tax=Microbacterium sp. 1.5R TaxID=1916917 RepID=UPI000ACAC54E|nr:substrate-binding domain-containing protein [Microbacterium sp. 1.5R]